jgi:hypothetical protein
MLLKCSPKWHLTIQEDASLNYAKLSYEIGNSYQSVPAVLLGFIKKYPNNASRSVVEKLLIDLHQKLYEALVLEKNKALRINYVSKVTL